MPRSSSLSTTFFRLAWPMVVETLSALPCCSVSDSSESDDDSDEASSAASPADSSDVVPVFWSVAWSCLWVASHCW